MGLAASQARFLAITARKADCEFRSMQNAQEKLSITRELAQASADYQEAMNQTKLVWDFDGQGLLTQGLNYGLLMTPTEMNNYTPTMITERNGQIVLSTNYARAAKLARINENGGTARSKNGFSTFISQLCGTGIISSSACDKILELDNTYNEYAGYGSKPITLQDAYMKNLTGFTYRLKRLEKAWSSEGKTTLSDLFGSGSNKISLSSSNGAKNANKLIKNTAITTNALTISDIIKSDIVFVHTGQSNNEKTTFVKNVNDIFSVMEEMVKKVFSSDVTTQKALDMAGSYVRNVYLGNISNAVDANTGDKKIDAAMSAIVSLAKETNGYVVGAAKKDDTANDSYAVSLSNMFSAYLTYFENAINGFDNSGYAVASNVKNSTFVTNNPNYIYLLENDEKTSNDFKRANFYMELYNNLCVYGFTENPSISTDSAQLENNLKNGTYFLYSQSHDGYFYQNRYNDVDCIVEVKDEDAIARAEAEFSAMKTKLTYKEEKLDLEMKNIDLELSALTTEYDSVKQIISNNVQKIFTQFQ